ncbi:MAG: hypothetical protein ACTSU9_16020, partial [Promethearchaeota archaeon]
MSKKLRFLEKIVNDLKEIGQNTGGPNVPELIRHDHVFGIGDASWLILRQHAVNKFMNLYLRRYRHFKGMKLVFIELKPGTGITRVTIPSEPDTLSIPCASLLAAYRRTFEEKDSFDRVISFETDGNTNTILENRFRMVEKSLPEEKRGYLKAATLQEDDDQSPIKQVITTVKKTVGHYFNYLFFINNDENWLNMQSLRFLKILKYGDVVISITKDTTSSESKENILEQLRSTNLDVKNEISVTRENGRTHSLLFCPRKEYTKLDGILKNYREILSIPPRKLTTNIRSLLVGKKPGIVSLVELIKKDPQASIKEEKCQPIKDILIYKKKQGYIRPLFDPMDERVWKDMLSKNQFDKLKINNNMVVLKKKITATDLNIKSACIQGKIRQKLGISSMDDREVIILDRRTSEYGGHASFPADGRLDGTAFWLRKHGN